MDCDGALLHCYDLRWRTAVRHHPLGLKIDAIMRNAPVLVTGNEYLAERARSGAAASIEINPTVVDTKRYGPAPSRSGGIPVVGWIGTPMTIHDLAPLLSLFDLPRCEIPVRFIAVGALVSDFSGMPAGAWAWSGETEVSSIQQLQDAAKNQFGKSSREREVTRYSLQSQAPRFLKAIAEAAR